MGAGGDRLGAKERLIARKQRNKMSTSRHNWYKANQRVHTQHYLVQYDDEIASPGEGSNERDAEMDLSQQRLLLLQLALLTTVTAELEDLRSDEDRAADHLMFGPHDHASGPASMEREVRADEYSCAGKLDPPGFDVETAPSVHFFSRDFILAHPRWLFMYPDMAAPDIGKKQVNDAIPKDCTSFCKGTPLARVCRPLANTLPIPVCTADGASLTDASARRNKLRFQKVTRRVLARARSYRIDKVIFMPEDRFDGLQDFTATAPTTAAALDAQLNHVRRRADNFVPKGSKKKDSGDSMWHDGDSERVLTSTPGDYADLEVAEEVPNYWGLRPFAPAPAPTLQTKLRHPMGRASHDGYLGNDSPVGAFTYGNTHDGRGQFVVCIDEGSTALAESCTGFMAIELVKALGLRLNTRHRIKIRTAGADGADGEHLTYGSVRANLTIGGQPIGTHTYYVNNLPGSTGLILGFNEKRRLNIETVCSELAAPDCPKLKFLYPGVDGGPATEHIVDTIPKPASCPLKEAHCDYKADLHQMQSSEAEALANLHSQIGELTHDDVELPAELTEAGYFLNYIEAFDDDRGDTMRDAVSEMNELGIHMRHSDGSEETVSFEILEGDEFDLLAGEIYGRQMRSEAIIGEDVFELHYIARGEHHECNIKAVDEVVVSDADQKELLKDFKPDKLPAEYGLCPEFVEKLKVRAPDAEALAKRCDDFWSKSGRCGNEAEMKRKNLKGPEVELRLAKGQENVTWYHPARYSEHLRAVADEYIDRLEGRGFIVPATSSKYLSRLLFIRKQAKPNQDGEIKDPGWRVCVDGRKMNSVVESTHVHLPSVTSVLNDLPNSLNGGREPITSDDKINYMNVCDFTMGFHSLRYKEGLSQELNSFTSHRGNYMWTVCSQGQASSPALYVQAVTDCLNAYGLCAGERRDKTKLTEDGKRMHEIFSTKTEEYGDWRYLDHELSCKEDDYWFVLTYVDDSVTLARDLRQCDRRAFMLMYMCTACGLWLQPEKNHTHVKAADLLGNTVACVEGEVRIYAQRKKVAAIMAMPEPRDKKRLLSCLASASWWRRACPNFGNICAPLYALTAADKNVARDWGEAHTKAWEALKDCISRATCRYPSNPALQKVLVTDAAQGKRMPDGTVVGGGLGGFCCQINDKTGMLQPLGFMARPLIGSEKEMSPRGLERRAIIATLHAFADELVATQVVIQCRTDHQGLCCLKNNDRTSTLSQIEATELNFLNKFRISLVYQSGTSPIMAFPDMLSRNVPSHADEIGSFGGGTEERPWGLGRIDKEVGARDDVDLKTVTPDYNSKLKLLDPDVFWDGPANDPEPNEIYLLSAPELVVVEGADPDPEDPRNWTSDVFTRCGREDCEILTAEGWAPPQQFLVTSAGEEGENVELLANASTKLGKISPLDAQVKSAPNILEPHELVTLKTKIVYPPGSFARKVWDRWHGKASQEDVRATNVHFPLYRVMDGLLQKKVLGNNAEHVYAIVVPNNMKDLQRAIVKYYHEATQHPGGITTWKMIRNKYVWGAPGDMKRQVQNHCDQCTVCQKFKTGNHAPFASPRCTIAAPVPFASISGDVFDMPPTVDGYDSILLIICNWSKYCVLIPMKSKGLTTPSFTRIYPEFEGKTTAWTSETIAYKLYKRVFSVFGLSLHLRTDGQASLFKGVWPTLMKLLGVDQLVGTAMSSSSNGICERKIKDLRRMFSPIMDRGGAMAWKIATIAVQVAANNIPNENEMTPEQLVLSFMPRRVQDLIHDVSSLPDSAIKRLLEDRNALAEELRLQNADAQQAATERLMIRQAGRFRDLPPTWGDPGKSFWVWLRAKYYSRAETKKSGASNKQLNVHSDGPFAVTKVHADKIHFEIDMPEWMARRKDNRFTIKAIKAITDEHPDPTARVRDAIENDAGGADELGDDEFVITKLWARRYDAQRERYQYKVLWAGCPASEASYVDEDQIDASELMEEFDARCPRGSTRTDSDEDKAVYLKANPGLFKLKPSAASITASSSPSKAKSTRTSRGHSTKTYEDGPAAPTTTSARGRTRRAPPRLTLSMTEQQRLHDHLFFLMSEDVGDYEAALNDWDHVHDVLLQDYDTHVTCGWGGDYGNLTYIHHGIDGDDDDDDDQMDEASLLKTCIRTPLDAKSDEVEGFSDDIEIMEIPRIGHRKVPLRRGMNQIGERRRNRLLH